MTQYRDHRGGLADSMATLQMFERRDNLVKYLTDCMAVFGFQITDDMVEIAPYAQDDRTGWHDHIVTVRGLGVVGFTDGPLTSTPTGSRTVGDGPSIDETIELIKIAHRDQVDKGGQPYWTHPVRVAARLLLRSPGIDPDAVKAALLHDVIEDTSFDEITLRAHGFSARTINLVKALSRDKSAGTYLQWIGSIAKSDDAELILIKLADNEDNCDPERLALLPKGVTALRERYEASMTKLRRALMQMQAKADYEMEMP